MRLFLAGVMMMAVCIFSYAQSEQAFTIDKPTYDSRAELRELEKEHGKLLGNMREQHQGNLRELAATDNNLSRQITQYREQLDKLQSKRFSAGAADLVVQGLQRIFVWILFPVMPLIALISNKLTVVFFPVTVAGLIVFVHSRYSFISESRSRWVTVVLLVALVLFFIPNAVKAQGHLDNLGATLDRTNALLELTDVERYILVLEERQQRSVALPNLESGHWSLKVYRHVQVDTVSYEHTLAALYFSNSRPGAAVDAIKRSLGMMDESNLTATQEFDAAINGITYLIDQQQRSDAAGAMEALATVTVDYSRLYRLLGAARDNGLLNSYEVVLKRIEELGRSENSVATMLSVARRLESFGESRLANEFLDRVVSLVETDEDLFELARFHQNRNESQMATEVYEKLLARDPSLQLTEKIYHVASRAGLNAVSTPALARLVALIPLEDREEGGRKEFFRYFSLAVDGEHTAIVKEGIEKVYTRYAFGEEFEAFIDRLINSNSIDYVRVAYETVLDDISVTDPDRVERVRAALESSLAKEQFDIASKATLLLATFLADATQEYDVHPPKILYSEAELPMKDDDINIRILYGILNQKLGFLDKAGEEYAGAIAGKLEAINEQHATNINPDLNDFYYLQRYFAETRNQAMFRKLQPIVEKMIADYDERQTGAARRELEVVKRKYQQELTALRAENQRELEARKKKIDAKREQFEKYPERLANARAGLRSANLGMYAETSRLFALMLVASLVVTGILMQGKRYADKWDHNKYFAFMAKVIESYGFFCIMTIVNIPIGIVTTWFGQWSIIHQLKHSEGEAKKLKGGSAAAS